MVNIEQLKTINNNVGKHQTSEAEIPGSNPASPTMILGRCRIIV